MDEKRVEQPQQERHRAELNSLRQIFSEETLRIKPALSLFYLFRSLLIFALLSYAIIQIDSLLLLTPLWLLLGLNLLGLYEIAHNAAHGSLFKSRLANHIVSQVAFLPVLHPCTNWRYGHNQLHHENTVRLRGDLAWHPRSPQRYLKMSASEKIMHRIYWSRGGAGIFYLIKMWWQGLIAFRSPLAGAGRDVALVVAFALCSSAAAIYFGGSQSAEFSLTAGLWLFAKLQLIPFLVANHFIGVTVYIQHTNPDIKWLTDEKWTPMKGQVEGTANYKLPSFINFFIYDMFIHVTHHIQPAIPFYNQKIAYREVKAALKDKIFEGGSFWRDYLNATHNCKLFDATEGVWCRYPEATRTG